MKRLLPFLLLTLVAPGVRAQSTLDQRRAAEPDGLVEIENPAGSIHVVGWDKNEVAVTGSLGARAEGLEFRGGAHRTSISVETEGNPHSVRSDLKIQVPAGSRLEIEGFAATIRIEGVNGPVTAETVNGTITMTGGSKEVNLQSVNGSVEVTSPATRVHAEAVNGSVTVREASGEVEASTVNGTLTVIGGTFTRAGLETVSGRIVFEGSARQVGHLERRVGERLGGPDPARLASPRTSPSPASAATSRTSWGRPRARPAAGPRRRSFRSAPAPGGAKVSVETLSGNIRLRKRP